MAYWFAPKRARSEAASSHHDTGAEHGIVHPAARSSIGSPVLDFVEGFALGRFTGFNGEAAAVVRAQCN